MNDILQLVGVFIFTLGVSMAISFFFIGRKRKQVKLLPLHENTSVRMIGPGGVYRCYYLRKSKDGLVFSAPLQRNVHVPLRKGEVMMVQAAVAQSVLTFRSPVIGRDADTHEFTLDYPERFRHVDRRSEPRDSSIGGTIIRINQQPATLLDISAQGARLFTRTNINPGDVVSIDLPDAHEPAYGWALESTPDSMGTNSGRTIRIRFEQPLTGLDNFIRKNLYLS